MTAKNPAAQVSIIIPTYNESQNIINVLKSVRDSLPENIITEAIVVDDNSPDGTGRIVDEYIRGVKKLANHTINVIHRSAKNGLSSAILNGISRANGETIVVMDSDLSHPPQVIPRMIEALKQSDIVIASRYVKGGAIQGWSLRRKLLSRAATRIAKTGLGIKSDDPMSGFFAFKRCIISGLKFDGLGYKTLLEILVKARGASVTEIPYTFIDRQFGASKMDASIILDYVRSVWRLYRHGQSIKPDRRSSVRFLSKAARFYTVGASGLGVNYVMSLLLAGGIGELWYLHANIIGIISSMTTNFFLNKYWTFEDRKFGAKRTSIQYAKFVLFSSLGALVQLGLVYVLVESHNLAYPLSLVLAVMTASFGNFVLNKRLTFRERLWS